MANATTGITFENNGSQKKTRGTLVLSGTYSDSTGEVLTKANLGLNSIEELHILNMGLPSYLMGVTVSSDGETAEIRLYTATSTEVADTTAISGNFQFVASGK